MTLPMVDSELNAVDLGRGLRLAIPDEATMAFSQWNADVADSFAPNTHRALHSALRGYALWCQQVNHTAPLPASLDMILAYCEHLVAAGRKRSTLAAHVWALNLIHEALELANPFATKRWKRRWPGILRNPRLHARKESKKGLTFDLLVQAVAAIEDDLRGLRDAALLRVAYDTLCRRSELVAMRWEDIERHEDGSGLVHVLRSKTDQEGVGMMRFLRPDTMKALDHWGQALVLAGAQLADAGGALFRPVPRAIEQSASARPLSTRQIPEIIKQRLGALGSHIDPADYAAHSTRIGACEDLLASGADLGLVMLAGGWSTSTQPVKYARKLDVRRGAMAALASAQARIGS